MMTMIMIEFYNDGGGDNGYMIRFGDWGWERDDLH